MKIFVTGDAGFTSDWIASNRSLFDA